MAQGYLTPLDRLQADAVNAAAGGAEWLDQHQEDVLAVWKEHGTAATANILGMSGATLRGWAKRRGLADGLIAKRTRGNKSSRNSAPHPGGPRAVERKPADTRGDGYWRGQAEAYKHALELVCTVMGQLPGAKKGVADEIVQ